MKRRKFFRGLPALAAVLAAAVLLLTGCAGGGDARDVVYGDMQAAFEQSGLLSANIGLFSKTETDGEVRYGECGSGVVFEKRDGAYYALTCAHVVADADAQVLVFTTNSELKQDVIPGMENVNVLSRETYDAMYPAQVEYVSDRDDLAVIRFETDEDLAAAVLADADPARGDRILCVGNPQNDWFAVSYGAVTSGIKKFGEAHGYPSNAMRHSAYMQTGSSGGAAFNEQMRLAGVTPGGSYAPGGDTFRYGVLIPVGELRLCLDAWRAATAE